MKKIGDLTASQSSIVPLKSDDEISVAWKDEMNFPEKLKEEIFIKRLEGPLFFGYTSDFQQLALEIPETATHMIIRMGKSPYIDQSGLYAMEEVLLEISKKGIIPMFKDLQPQPRAMMEQIDVIPDLVPKERIFKNLNEALVYAKENVKDRI